MIFPEYIQGYKLLSMMKEISSSSRFFKTLFPFFNIIEIVKEAIANKVPAAHI